MFHAYVAVMAGYGTHDVHTARIELRPLAHHIWVVVGAHETQQRVTCAHCTQHNHHTNSDVNQLCHDFFTNSTRTKHTKFRADYCQTMLVTLQPILSRYYY